MFATVARRLRGDPNALAPAIRREVQAIDPEQPVGQVATMEENIESSLAARRLTMTLLGHVRRARTFARERRTLRRDGLERDATDARARDSSRARRGAKRMSFASSWGKGWRSLVWDLCWD